MDLFPVTRIAAGMGLSANDRVRKHRAKLLDRQRCRLEVCVGIALIDRVRLIARSRDKPMWSVVEAAVEAYTEEYEKFLADNRDLTTSGPVYWH